MSTLDSLGVSLRCDMTTSSALIVIPYACCSGCSLLVTVTCLWSVKEKKRGAQQPPLSADAVIRHGEAWMPWGRRSGLALTHQKKCMATSDEINRFRRRAFWKGWDMTHNGKARRAISLCGLQLHSGHWLHRVHWKIIRLNGALLRRSR